MASYFYILTKIFQACVCSFGPDFGRFIAAPAQSINLKSEIVDRDLVEKNQTAPFRPCPQSATDVL